MLGEPHSPTGIPTLEALRQTRSLALGFLGLGCCGPGLGPRGALAGGSGFSCAGGRGQGAGSRGRRPSGDAETEKPAALQRGSGNQGARPGSRGFLLTAWKSPCALCPLWALLTWSRALSSQPVGLGALAALRTGAGCPGSSPPPCVTAALQKDAPIRSLWAPLWLTKVGGRHFLRSRGVSSWVAGPEEPAAPCPWRPGSGRRLSGEIKPKPRETWQETRPPRGRLFVRLKMPRGGGPDG